MLAEVLIPLTFMLVTGLVISLFIHYRAKEKQFLIEKGLTPEQMLEFYSKKENKLNSTLWLKIGVLSIALGFGIGIGNILDDYYRMEELIAFCIFVFLGLGFIGAFFVGRKFEDSAK